MYNFKIENFCQINGSEFKVYYNYLNNPLYLPIIYYYYYQLKTEHMKKYILNLIVNNHSYIIDRLKKIDIIISFYKQNNLINKSEIGKFFHFYEIHRKKVNLNEKNNKELTKNFFELFYKLIYYDRCLEVLKECFYIFSDYRACIYFLTPSINFYNTKKEIIEKVIDNFKDNINTCTQIISKTYVEGKNPWGSTDYATAYAMFETLIIIKKYFKDPLKKLDIKFVVKKTCVKKNIFEKLCEKYHKQKMKVSDIDDKIIPKNIHNISQFILNLKRLGYDLWFVINLVFDTIYEEYVIEGIPDALCLEHNKIYLKKSNNMLGFMCYVLTNEGFISNINIFKNFND